MRSRTMHRNAVCGLLFALAAMATSAQKVQTSYDKAAQFKQYHRYTWAKNSLFSRQTAQMEVTIEQTIKKSTDNYLHSRGFIKDPAKPDFYIHYDAGAMPNIQASDQTQIVMPIATVGAVTVGQISDVPVDVWQQVVGTLRYTIQDASSKTTVWQATVTKKTYDPQKFLDNLQNEIDKMTKKGLEKFPPK